jgi:hypothetical protein
MSEKDKAYVLAANYHVQTGQTAQGPMVANQRLQYLRVKKTA